MSKGRVTFCKYIHWKWSKEDNTHLIKTSRNGEKTDLTTFSLQANKQKDVNKKDVNKKEVCNSRISQRDLMIQTSINPYMIKNDYLQDIDIQDNFLRPQDSNF
jgi:hypothetical protein